METLRKSQSCINGEWCDAKSGEKFEVFNPSNGVLIGQVANCEVPDAMDAIDAAHTAFQTWKKKSGMERAEVMKKWSDLIVENADTLGEILTMENGKPFAEARGEIIYSAMFLDWFCEEGRRIYGETIPLPAANQRAQVLKEPIGVVGTIIPWNFPAAMVTRKLGPALVVGCTAIIKAPEDTPYTVLALAELADQAGFPKGVINVLSCNRENTQKVGKLLCESRKVATVSFTGSTAVGKMLMEQCAASVKRVSLELGGLSPFIIFDSANLDQVGQAAIFTKFRNAGQTCVSSQNYLIQDGVYNKAVEILHKIVRGIKVGQPMSPETAIGPLINKRGLDKVIRLVEDAKAKGATVLCGGKQAEEWGELYYEPTILTDVTNDMDIVHEEIFGPVMAVQRFEEESDAIRIANQSERGLAAYFFSQDMSQCHRVWESLECGLVGCNSGMVSRPELPFGGYKESGIGVESGKYGVEEFLTVKTVTITLL